MFAGGLNLDVNMTEIEERKVYVSHLQVGMFVCRLDRPWQETQFPLQGVFIQSKQDIDALCDVCEYVFVDLVKCKDVSLTHRLQQLNSVKSLKNQRLNTLKRKSSAQSSSVWKKKFCVESYTVANSLDKEIPRASSIFNDIEKQVESVFDGVHQHQRLSVEPMVEKVTDLVASVVRNPDALAWVCRIKEGRSPIYLHSLRLAVWGCIFGRQLGLNRFSLLHVTMTLVMSGIGKSLLDSQALNGYSPISPNLAYKQHLKETLFHLTQFHFSCEDIIVTLSNYCERHDGSGYPAGRSGAGIPFLARVAGLVETFELLINPFDRDKSVSAANAIGYLNRKKDALFEGELIEVFVKAVGIYPTGSLVELNDGAVGIVYSQTQEKRLRASVIPLIDHKGNKETSFNVIDLDYGDASAQDQSTLKIKRGVPYHAVSESVVAAAHEHMFNSGGGLWSGVKKMFG